MPDATPEYVPVALPTVATAVLEEVHVPPDTDADAESVAPLPEQTATVPVTGK